MPIFLIKNKTMKIKLISTFLLFLALLEAKSLEKVSLSPLDYTLAFQILVGLFIFLLFLLT